MNASARCEKIRVINTNSYSTGNLNAYPCHCWHPKNIHVIRQNTEFEDRYMVQLEWDTCLFFTRYDEKHSLKCQCNEFKLDNLKYLEELSEK